MSPRVLLSTLLASAGLLSSAAAQVVPVCSEPPPMRRSLERPEHIVVRLCTTLGAIDLELYTTNAPATTANFLSYVRDHSYDGSFLHRLVNGPRFVLQGGGFTYTDAAGLSLIPARPPIALERTGRRNVVRSVGMARTSDPNSATTQFYINLVDNLFLDPGANGEGFAVFGRVLRGWDVVERIVALRSLDFMRTPPFDGVFAGSFQTTPVLPDYTPGNPVREADLIFLGAREITPNPCEADLDNGTFTGTPDGGVTVDDLLYYLFLYADGLPAADLDDGTGTGTPDGGVTIDDLLYYLLHYEAGC